MQEHPHLLIAGETGSGKSTQIRSVLTTLIKSQSPNELRLILADMKRSEFHLFRNVAHVDAVCTTTDELTVQLSRISSELEKRGDLLDRLELTHTSQISRSERPPNMIVCIDEVALLKKEKDIMEVIENISSIGRALGVFLILSMQRPDAKVLDGKLKNNLTVRMAFRHADTINSRITMGSGEAAGITTKGRMWLKIDKPREIQGPYLEETEAKKLLADYKVRPKEEKKEVEKIFGTLEGDFD
jgi:S-DNA-T family DNA segregation ATPase FtsK/SpoIIIE